MLKEKRRKEFKMAGEKYWGQKKEKKRMKKQNEWKEEGKEVTVTKESWTGRKKVKDRVIEKKKDKKRMRNWRKNPCKMKSFLKVR